MYMARQTEAAAVGVDGGGGDVVSAGVSGTDGTAFNMSGAHGSDGSGVPELMDGYLRCVCVGDMIRATPYSNLDAMMMMASGARARRARRPVWRGSISRWRVQLAQKTAIVGRTKPEPIDRQPLCVACAQSQHARAA